MRGSIPRDGAHLLQTPQFAQAYQLHQRVPSRRRLERPGDHRRTEGVGQSLVQPHIARAASYNMYLIDYSTCQLADLLEHFALA